MDTNEGQDVTDGADDRLDDLADQASVGPSGRPDSVERVLLPTGRPETPDGRAQLFELYKIMVQTSEALVARRQGTNTYFLTANGLLLTAIGLFVRQGANVRSHSAVVAIFCITGLIVSWAWRTLLISFGQLNKGKFAVILRLEKALTASIFDAEWEALDRGRNKKTYRSFTKSESRVPLIFGAVYLVALVISVLIAINHFPRV